MAGVHGPPAERDDRAVVAADRDHQAVPKAIDGRAVVALHHQSASQQKRQRESFLEETRPQPLALDGA